MAPVSFTSANFRLGDDAVVGSGLAGATVAPGDWLYLNSTDNEYYPANATTSLASANVVACAATHGTDGKKIAIVTGGSIEASSAAWTAGSTYNLDGVDGQATEAGDETAATDYVTTIGHAVSTTKFVIGFNATGVLHP